MTIYARSINYSWKLDRSQTLLSMTSLLTPQNTSSIVKLESIHDPSVTSCKIQKQQELRQMTSYTIRSVESNNVIAAISLVPKYPDMKYILNILKGFSTYITAVVVLKVYV